MSVTVGSEEGPFGLKSILATAFPLVLIVRRSVPAMLPPEVFMERRSVPETPWKAARIEAIKLASCAAFDCGTDEPVPDKDRTLDMLIRKELRFRCTLFHGFYNRN